MLDWVMRTGAGQDFLTADALCMPCICGQAWFSSCSYLLCAAAVLLRLCLLVGPHNWPGYLELAVSQASMSKCSVHSLILRSRPFSSPSATWADCQSYACTTLLLLAMLVLQAALLSLDALMQEQHHASVLRLLAVARRCYAVPNQFEHHQLCLAGGISGCELLISQGTLPMLRLLSLFPTGAASGQTLPAINTRISLPQEDQEEGSPPTKQELSPPAEAPHPASYMQIMDMLKKVGISAGSSLCSQAAGPSSEALHAANGALKPFTS